MKLSKAARQGFADYIVALRAKTGMTQREVAHLSGVSHSYIALMESGRRNSPSYRFLEQLASIYQVGVEEVAQQAGYKAWQQSATIPRERIEWAFDCACKDPDFTHGMHVIPELETLSVKAFVVELYERTTGRNLLVVKEKTEVLPLINGGALSSDPSQRGDDGVQESDAEEGIKTDVAVETLPIRKCRMPKPAEENKAAVVVKPAPTERKIRV